MSNITVYDSVLSEDPFKTNGISLSQLILRLGVPQAKISGLRDEIARELDRGIEEIRGQYKKNHKGYSLVNTEQVVETIRNRVFQKGFLSEQAQGFKPKVKKLIYNPVSNRYPINPRKVKIGENGLPERTNGAYDSKIGDKTIRICSATLDDVIRDGRIRYPDGRESLGRVLVNMIEKASNRGNDYIGKGNEMFTYKEGRKAIDFRVTHKVVTDITVRNY